MSNSEKYNNVFSKLAFSFRGSAMSGWILVLSVAMMLIGANFFFEDLTSSRWGMEMLESQLNIRATSWEYTFWAGSLAFQVFSMVSFFIYMSDQKNHWQWFWVALAVQAGDVAFDLMYRSNGVFDGGFGRVAVIFAYTILVTSALSEGALSLGLGASVAMIKDSDGAYQLGIIIKSFFMFWRDIFRAFSDKRPTPSQGGHGNPNPQQNQRPKGNVKRNPQPSRGGKPGVFGQAPRNTTRPVQPAPRQRPTNQPPNDGGSYVPLSTMSIDDAIEFLTGLDE